ncbi:hypothetical protein GGF46_001957 [Coemansia sp. RSA 552]|nr:hypothetical protein GGF46_001957 [Coemansia sp. RSA 552]
MLPPNIPVPEHSQDVDIARGESDISLYDPPGVTAHHTFANSIYSVPVEAPSAEHQASTDGKDPVNVTNAPEKFVPSVKAWVCALLFTTIEAMVAPLFLFRAYSLPITPLLIPVFVYPLCHWSAQSAEPSGPSNEILSTTEEPPAEPDGPPVKNSRHAPLPKPKRISRTALWRQRLGFMFSREEMAWITSMVAAGGSFAPAYQWIATIDIDYGQPLGRWQQFVVVLSTQLFGWSLGDMLRHIFVGRRSSIVWPDTLPLSYLIQTLYLKRPHAGTKAEQQAMANPTTVDGEFSNDSDADDTDKHKVYEEDKEEGAEGDTSLSEFAAASTSKTHLAFLTAGTFVYQVTISYIAPIFKSLCLLCLWAPKNKLVSLLGSGWNGTGILSMTFDWEALGTLQPLVTPLWAQVQYYAGAFLMTYILTPIGWHLDWWGSQSLPIVSTNVFDTMGGVYNISLVHRFRNPEAEDVPIELSQYEPGVLMYKTYSPVRLTVNSALVYICSVAAIAAATVHLALWHPQWLRCAVSDMAHAMLRLWDPRPLFRARRPASSMREASSGNLPGSVGEDTPVCDDEGAEQLSPLAQWDIGFIIGRIGRVLIFTLTLGVALLSPQLGISALPGWQSLIAICWAMIMCLPIGFIEAVTGFTMPMDLLPHMFGGLIQGPGTPIETSYFHLWATIPIRVALGWPGVRSFQLVHHCCPQDQTPADELDADQRQNRILPWLKRGLLIGIVWGACVNHASYIVFSRSLDPRRSLPIEALEPIDIEPPMPSVTFDMASPGVEDLIDEYYDNEEEVDQIEIAGPLLGWHEPGEFGRLPAALSSELVVWGIVGTESLLSAASPYRMLFVYGALIGTLLPPLFYFAHRGFARLSRPPLDENGGKRGRWRAAAKRLAAASKAVQIPLVLTGMVAVPTIPANFAITGFAVAVLGQLWFRCRQKSLVDRSLYSAMLYMGTRLAIVVMFAVGQILTTRQMTLTFVNWWGNQIGNVEGCAEI